MTVPQGPSKGLVKMNHPFFHHTFPECTLGASVPPDSMDAAINEIDVQL